MHVPLPLFSTMLLSISSSPLHAPSTWMISTALHIVASHLKSEPIQSQFTQDGSMPAMTSFLKVFLLLSHLTVSFILCLRWHYYS
jgi:hypothetical protein